MQVRLRHLVNMFHIEDIIVHQAMCFFSIFSFSISMKRRTGLGERWVGTLDWEKLSPLEGSSEAPPLTGMSSG